MPKLDPHTFWSPREALTDRQNAGAPLEVRAAFFALVGDGVDVTAAVAERSTHADGTTWHVIVLTEGLLVDIVAAASTPDWDGDSSWPARDHEIMARAWPRTAVSSVALTDATAAALPAYVDWSTAWRIDLRDGTTIELPSHARDRERSEAIALQLLHQLGGRS